MEVYKITNLETGKVWIKSTIYSAEHEWLRDTADERSLIYEDIQIYGLSNFRLDKSVCSLDYDKDKTAQDNKRDIKAAEKECVKEFCKEFGALNLYNVVRGSMGNTASMNKNRSYIYKFDNCDYATGVEVFNAFVNAGIDMSVGAVLAFLHHNKYLSKANREKYPDLDDRVTVISCD